MWILNKFRWELPQETHPWHIYSPNLDLDNTIMLIHSGEKIRPNKFSPLIHMPLLGGPEKFWVVRPSEYKGIWHIGWIFPDGKNELNKLPLTGPVRLLVGKGKISFYGVTPDLSQISLTLLTKGHLGDRSHSNTRLL